MDYNNFYEEFGEPFAGRKKKRLIEFLKKCELDYDEQIEYTVNLVTSEGEIAATGSLHQNVLKCIAVDEKYQGMGLSAKIVTLLMNEAMKRSREHLFLFTKPKNQSMFSDLGFYEIIKTDHILLMENRKNGIREYVSQLKRSEGMGTVGAVVMNCNPFTLGHRYLIEQATSQCDELHIFVLSEDRSAFPADVRYRLVQEGTKDLPNVTLHPSSDYLISSAVFPTYFIKDKIQAEDMNCELDLIIFAEYFAKELNIKKRFVGSEPLCKVTNSYNEAMKRVLPLYGIELVEIPRTEIDGTPVSASLVRKYMADGDFSSIKNLVPKTTYQYICSEEGRRLAEKLAQQRERNE